MSIPLNHKFACLAFHWLAAQPQEQPVLLTDGSSVYSRPPFDLDDTWTEWLGSIEVTKLRESNFVILATAASTNPAVMDDEHEALTKKVHSLWYAMLMHGVPDHEGVLSLQGSNVHGTVQVRSHSSPPPYYRPRYVRPALVTNDMLRSADTVTSGMQAIYQQRGSFARLKRGFTAAWLTGMQERYGDARLHQFVRATEALIKPRIAETKRNFRHRGTTVSWDIRSKRKLAGRTV